MDRAFHEGFEVRKIRLYKIFTLSSTRIFYVIVHQKKQKSDAWPTSPSTGKKKS